VRLGGEIHHGVGAVLGQQARDQDAIGDVALHEHVVRISAEVCQRLQVPGVGERIEVDHAQTVRDRLTDEIGADEAGAASDKQGSHAVSLRLLRLSKRTP
jgi:hypothetical protein